jgi:hypothetical protein
LKTRSPVERVFAYTANLHVELRHISSVQVASHWIKSIRSLACGS